MIDKPDPDEQRLQDAVDALAEYFDSLIIFATRYESESESGEQGTVGITKTTWQLLRVLRASQGMGDAAG